MEINPFDPPRGISKIAALKAFYKAKASKSLEVLYLFILSPPLAGNL